MPLNRGLTMPLSQWAATMALLVVAAVGLSTPAKAEAAPLQSEWKPAVPLATWAWDWGWANIRPEQFEDWAAGLLDLCAKRNVGTVYLGMDLPVAESRVSITEQLLERAHARGVRVEACPVDRGYQGTSWAHPGGEQGAYDFFDRLIAWNGSRPRAQHFDGANLDVEEATGHWLQVLKTLAETKTPRLKEITPKFAVGIWATPAWWWGTEENREKFIYRLQDYTDYVSVGAYFQGDRARDFFTGPSKPGLDYAAKTGKKILLGLETEVWLGEGQNYPGWQHMSFATLGELELRRRIDRINDALQSSPGFGGVVLQSYNAYRALCLVQDEIERDAALYGALDRQAEALGEGLPAHIGGFAAKPGHSAEDAALKTQLVTFEIAPALQPGHVLVFRAQFGAYASTRPNPLTEQAAVPAEVFWLGFRKTDAESRILRIDHTGSLGLRVVNGNGYAPQLLPAEWRDRFRTSFTRFAPEPGKEYELRLYCLPDSRVMLKVVEPGKPEALWHSERMTCVERNLRRMYLEVAASPPGGQIGSLAWDPATGCLTVLRDRAALATIRNLRVVPLPEPQTQPAP